MLKLKLRSKGGRIQRQRGISLLESLVSLLMLALGVLGLLGVQLRTMTESQTGNSRLIAARLSDDLFERLKSNPGGWATMGNYVVGWGAAPAAGTNCAAANCTVAQKATWEIAQWKTLVGNTLPSGQATVFVSPSDPRQLGVMIAWRSNERSAAADYVAPFVEPVADGALAVNCPASRICHLAYSQP